MNRIPREAYVDQDWFDREQSTLFAKSWAFAGVTSDFGEAGDYRAVQQGLYPIVVIRLADGSLAAYHNICRHRGTVLLEGTGNTGKAIICPYHRWTYDIGGKFRGAPNMSSCFPDLDRGAMSLKPAAIGVFNDLVFVNPDPKTDFQNWIAPIADKAWPHDLNADDAKEAAPLIYDMKCDWKVFVENAIDGYHLSYLHENTLGGPKPDENIWERHGDHLIWYALDEAEIRHALPAKSRKEFADYWTKPIAATEGREFGGVYFLFPNILITATPFTFSISWLEPISAGRCHLHVRQWTGPGQSRDDRTHIPGFDPKTGAISSDNWTKPPLETRDFQTEDVWICEKNQRGLESPAYENGPLAQGAGAEDPICWLQDALTRAMA